MSFSLLSLSVQIAIKHANAVRAEQEDEDVTLPSLSGDGKYNNHKIYESAF